jgi:acetyl-CoA carboxylase biotin carboxyl carrier protein
MNIKELRELIKLVAEKQFAEFELEQSDFKLRIKRNSPPVIQYSDSPVVSAPNPTSAIAQAAATAAAAAAQPAAVEMEEPLYKVTSPIPGTFYRAPSPTADPFVSLGDRVSPGTTLCIIEAMKLMNEITSDVSGEIAAIYADNGQAVEFGQPLLGIKVSGR